ncbi:MAG: aminoacetone oxidase family FAD-binding enzyme [Bacteroidales bacterium]|nr:aminoacetone oxidase family FAD-binding enzyme [Bacteroidales bacterium]
MDIAIIGAGAAGCFCAVALKRSLPAAGVVVLEAGPRPLAKVAITGGGRCNLTNSFEGISRLAEAYPRGENLMKRALSVFGWKQTWEWFEREGVPLVLQEDNCVFPKSQDAMQIVRLLEGLCRSLGVEIRTGWKVASVCRENGKYRISREIPLPKGETSLPKGQIPASGASEPNDNAESFDIVVVTSGGSPKMQGISFLEPLGLKIEPPVPSLFTFNINDKSLRSLMGCVVENTVCRLSGTKFRAQGALLVTDWGVSGPAVLKLSSYGARYLAERDYKAELLINWLGSASESEVEDMIETFINVYGQKLVANVRPPQLTSRLWKHLTGKAAIGEDTRWAALSSKQRNRLVRLLTCDPYPIEGKSRFREEFVTCGGVSLSEINLSTLEARRHPGLYFAGEVLDVDAITGGFNLQAAWSMGHIAAQSIFDKNSYLYQDS